MQHINLRYADYHSGQFASALGLERRRSRHRAAYDHRDNVRRMATDRFVLGAFSTMSNAFTGGAAVMNAAIWPLQQVVGSSHGGATHAGLLWRGGAKVAEAAMCGVYGMGFAAGALAAPLYPNFWEAITADRDLRRSALALVQGEGMTYAEAMAQLRNDVPKAGPAPSLATKVVQRFGHSAGATFSRRVVMLSVPVVQAARAALWAIEVGLRGVVIVAGLVAAVLAVPLALVVGACDAHDTRRRITQAPGAFARAARGDATAREWEAQMCAVEEREAARHALRLAGHEPPPREMM